MDAILHTLAEEVDLYPEAPELNVDHDQFITLDEADMLVLVTLRDKGKLLGFHLTMLMSDIFYKHILTGYVSCYFLDKGARGRGVGARMFEYADDVLKDKGAKRVFMSRKIYINNEALFDKLGYTQIESNYTKAMT